MTYLGLTINFIVKPSQTLQIQTLVTRDSRLKRHILSAPFVYLFPPKSTAFTRDQRRPSRRVTPYCFFAVGGKDR